MRRRVTSKLVEYEAEEVLLSVPTTEQPVADSMGVAAKVVV